MQRILTRGEIETLDRTRIVRVIPAAPDTFSIRAQRLRQLAPDNPIQDYLLLIAQLADAQQQVSEQSWSLPLVDEVQAAQAQSHGMSLFSAANAPRDTVWQHMLTALIEQLQQQELPEPVRHILQELADTAPEALEQQASALLNQQAEHINAAQAPFIMAALQLYWSLRVKAIDPTQVPAVTPFGLCPCCGSQPVSSSVQVGGPKEQIRYATCSLCATQWHIVRVVCTHCEDTKTIAYHSLDEGNPAIKAESCDHCQHYRKIFYLDKDPHADAFADDLASLPLDILMGEARFYRANNSPYLWQPADAS
ncbi:formate dehydrogenase accessory protein FdhE [Oceanimonas baumannii]|uniref:formate dehydrogenase accessory protein FdhE n=1 Tax=Oceanimonas baumannii TaxID=129578 RepID=UPI003A907FDB